MGMAWMDSPFERRTIRSGMRVRTEDGTKLGRVAMIGREVVYVQRHRFSRDWRAVSLARVCRVTGGDVYVTGTPAEVSEGVTRERLRTDIPTYTHPLAEAAATVRGHA